MSSVISLPIRIIIVDTTVNIKYIVEQTHWNKDFLYDFTSFLPYPKIFLWTRFVHKAAVHII